MKGVESIDVEEGKVAVKFDETKSTEEERVRIIWRVHKRRYGLTSFIQKGYPVKKIRDILEKEYKR